MSDFWVKCEGIAADDAMLAYGRIRVGDFDERFEMDLSYWDVPRYEQQWRDAILRLLQGIEKSCLISAMGDPGTANFIVWWPVYRVEEVIHVQNHILFLDGLAQSLDPSDPYGLVPERRIESCDGERISEWTTTLDAVRRFVE